MFENTLSIMIFLPIFAGLALLVLPVGRDAARAAGLVVAVIGVALLQQRSRLQGWVRGA